jgi:hypothetical protein
MQVLARILLLPMAQRWNSKQQQTLINQSTMLNPQWATTTNQSRAMEVIINNQPALPKCKHE